MRPPAGRPLKLLLITANFAPRSASPAIRTVNLATAFARLGHHVAVVTYDPGTQLLFSPEDRALTAKLPEAVQISRVRAGALRRLVFARAPEGGAAATLAKRTRLRRHALAQLLVPDPHVDAIMPFIRRGQRMVQASRPDVILTFGYPYSMHIVGYALKRMAPDVLWAADYGDPWCANPTEELRRAAWRRRLDRGIERRLLDRCDQVFVTTPATRTLYEHAFPAVRGRIAVAPMGYDPEDMAAAVAWPRDEAEQTECWLVHTGSLYESARNPIPMIEAIEHVVRARPELAARIRLILIGNMTAAIEARVAGSSAANLVVCKPWMEQAESLRWVKAADRVVLFGNRGQLQVPGKLFQYLGARKPILYLHETDADPVIAMVREAGGVAVPNAVGSIEAELSAMAVSAGRAEPVGGSGPARDRSEEHTWGSVAKSVSDILEQGMSRSWS